MNNKLRTALLVSGLVALTTGCTVGTGIGGRVTGGGGLTSTPAFREWAYRICSVPFSGVFCNRGNSGGGVNFNNVAFTNCGVSDAPAFAVRGSVQVKDASKGTWTCELQEDGLATDALGVTVISGIVTSARFVRDANGNDVSRFLDRCDIAVGRGGPSGRPMVVASAYDADGPSLSTQGGELTIGNVSFHRVNETPLCNGVEE